MAGSAGGGAAGEGTAVTGLLRDGYVGEVRHLEGPVTRAAFLRALAGCSLLHFAGHSQVSQGAVRGGFQLSDGIASPEDVIKACGAAAPALVFANSCSSSTRTGWTEASTRTFSLASALLMRGSQHYIGPMWDVPDEDALSIALRFYEKALSGISFGEALRSARATIATNGRHPLSFAGYVLYGQPRSAFPAGSVRLSVGRDRMRSASAAGVPVGNFPSQVHAAAPDLGGLPMPHPASIGGRLLKYGRWFVIAGSAAGLVAKSTQGLFEFVRTGKQVGSVAGAIAPEVHGAVVPVVTAAPTKVAMLGSAIRHEGPVRVAILPFKNLSEDAKDKAFDVSATMQEAIITGMGESGGVTYVEQAQAEAQQHYAFDETWAKKWVIDGKEVAAYDRDTLAALGKFEGAEVLVVGAYQRSGRALRANARFVNAETGVILDTLKIDRADGDVLKLEDDLAAATKKSLAGVKPKMRPEAKP